MIETRQAMDNLDDILSVPGLDGLYIGPSDLGISLGCAPSGGVPVDAIVIDAIKSIYAAARKHRIHPAIHCNSVAMAKQMVAQGFQFVTVLHDSAFLHAGASAAVAEMLQAGAGSKKLAY